MSWLASPKKAQNLLDTGQDFCYIAHSPERRRLRPVRAVRGQKVGESPTPAGFYETVRAELLLWN